MLHLKLLLCCAVQSVSHCHLLVLHTVVWIASSPSSYLSLPTSLSPLVNTGLFSTFESSFCFLTIPSFHLLDPSNDNRVFVFLRLMSLNIILWKRKKESEVTESCLTLCDPKDGGPPGSSVHGRFQARILEWVAISFSKIFDCPRS